MCCDTLSVKLLRAVLSEPKDADARLRDSVNACNSEIKPSNRGISSFPSRSDSASAAFATTETSAIDELKDEVAKFK